MLVEILIAWFVLSIIAIIALFGPIARRQYLHSKTGHLAPVKGDVWRLAGYLVKVHPALEYRDDLPGRQLRPVVHIETDFGWITIQRSAWGPTVKELEGYRVRSAKNG